MELYNTGQMAQNPYAQNPFGDPFQAGNAFSKNPWGGTYSGMANQPKPNMGTMAPAPQTQPMIAPNAGMAQDQDRAMVNEIAASMQPVIQQAPQNIARNQAADIVPKTINQPGIGQVQDPGLFKNKAEYDKWYEEQWRKKMAQQGAGQAQPQQPQVPVGRNYMNSKYNARPAQPSLSARPPMPAVPTMPNRYR